MSRGETAGSGGDPGRVAGGMSDSTARRLAWSALLLIVLLFIGSAVLAFEPGPSRTVGDALFALSTALFPVVAILILNRQPRNRIGWILMAIGFAWTAGGIESYGEFAVHRGLAGGALSLAISAPLWAPPIGLMGTSLILRFPNGRLLSLRWRKVERLAFVAVVATMIAIMLAPGSLADAGYPSLRNPIGIEALKPVLDLLLIFLLMIPVTIVASAVSLVQRFRRSTGTERLQLKWLAAAAAVVAAVYLLAMAASLGAAWDTATTPIWVAIIQDSAVASFVLIPIAVGIAILKYRLYDIDVVINKTLVYGALAAFITAVYVAIVVGIGAAIGSRGDAPNLGLSILATAVVALSFGPVRERVQRVANRLVYGARATPYEVLSSFSSRMATSYTVEDLLPKMAEALAKGTGAARIEVWLRMDHELRLEGWWPAADRQSSALLAEGAPMEDDRSRVVTVTHHGEDLGCIVVRRAPGDAFTVVEAKLIGDVAAQAGLVLRNVRLIEDLRASRQRLVAAQDRERRKLERNIHDGAQQRLVALAVRFGLARRLVGPDANGHGEAIGRLAEQTQAALENLRDLARGIYPPLLADHGLVAALDAQAKKAPLPVTVLATGIGRYSQEVEAAVYFCCLEALQNVAKYAEAAGAVIRLRASGGELAFDVEDDGAGFDRFTTPLGSGLTNMGDRLAALEGTLEVRSEPGRGTAVSGRLPVRLAEAVPA